MKNIIALATIATLFTGNVYAQKIRAAEVPEKVKQSFSNQFPNTVAKWEKENGQYEAGFKQQGHTMSALFNEDGGMTESEAEITITELPTAVIDFVKKYYHGSLIKEAAKITKANGEVNYEAALKDRDLIFDAQGKLIKEVKE